MDYVELMEKSNWCCLKAIEFASKGERELATFYKNASEGFKQKALKCDC